MFYLLQYSYTKFLWIEGLSVVFMVQGRRDNSVMLAVTSLLLHQNAMVMGLTLVLFVNGRGQISVIPSITSLLLHHYAIGSENDCNVVSRG